MAKLLLLVSLFAVASAQIGCMDHQANFRMNYQELHVNPVDPTANMVFGNSHVDLDFSTGQMHVRGDFQVGTTGFIGDFYLEGTKGWALWNGHCVRVNYTDLNFDRRCVRNTSQPQPTTIVGDPALIFTEEGQIVNNTKQNTLSFWVVRPHAPISMQSYFTNGDGDMTGTASWVIAEYKTGVNPNSLTPPRICTGSEVPEFKSIAHAISIHPELAILHKLKPQLGL
jgi:hypothetical protein